ncbi:flagellar assembly protein A [Sulfurimonas sp.]
MIKPVHVTTNNVKYEIENIEKKYSVSGLYIEIESVETFVTVGTSKPVEIYDDDFDKYTDEEHLRDENVKFEQEYQIEVRPLYNEYSFKDMISEIEFEENNTLAYFVIKKGSKLVYTDELFDDFMDYIDEQKLRANIMLYLFDTDYEDTIKSFVDVIQKVKRITFKEDKRILVSKGIGKVESVNSRTSMTIEEKNEIGAEDSEGKVDYANRGFLLSCEAGEQLFEFIKPQQGKNGRSCKGKLIEVEIINLDVTPEFTVDNNIEVQDSFENIKYLSSKSGYLIKNGNSYDVSNSIDVGEISFKTTGTINTDLETEISINVIKDNPLEDAVEEGMHVKVQNLSIEGSIGPSTEIEARIISITGQSHQDSTIKCVNADIGLHKGKVVGRKVEVKTLEGGEIIADTAIIKNAIRGTIKAKIIEIEALGSHVVMEASESIIIEKSKGEENRFIISPSVDSAFKKNKDDDKIYIKKFKDELSALIDVFKKSTSNLKKNLEPCDKIKRAIIKSKNQGIEVSSVLIEKFKMCKLMQVRYKKLKEDVTYKKCKYEELQKEQASNSTNMFDVQITAEQPLKGYNYIVYKLENPEREITLSTDDSMKKKIFKLHEDDDGVVKIINSND